MANLYQLTEDFLTVFNMFDDDEIDEQAIINTLESLEYEIEDKADGYAKIIKNMDSNIKGIKEEIDRLSNRKQVIENRTKFLKSSLETAMRTTGKTKFSTKLFSFNIQKNGGLRKLTIDTTNIEDIPKTYRIKQPDVLNNEKIRELLATKEDNSCDFAHLEPQGESLRIR